MKLTVWRTTLRLVKRAHADTALAMKRLEAVFDTRFWPITIQRPVMFWCTLSLLVVGLVLVTPTTVWEFIDAHNGAITAVFTVVLAVSTIFLWKSTNASAIAAKAAAEALPNIERAYLFITPDLQFWDEIARTRSLGTYSSRISASYTIKNHGKTPAIIISIDVRLQTHAEPPDNREHASRWFMPNGKILDPSYSWTPDNSPLGASVDEDAAEALDDRRLSIWFYGSVYYRDMFGNDHVTRFRWTWDALFQLFTADGDAPYNERQ